MNNQGNAPKLIARLFRAAKWAVAGRLAVVGSIFLLHILLTRVLSMEDYGVYLIVYSLVVLHAIGASFGLPKTILRLTRESLTKDDGERTRSCLRTTLGAIALSCAVTSVFFLGFVALFGERLFSRDLLPYSGWGVALIVLSALRQVAAETFRAFEDFRWGAFLGLQQGGIAQHGLAIVSLGLLAALGTVDLHVIFLLTTVSVLIPVGIAAPRLVGLYRGIPVSETSDASSRLSLGSLLKESSPIFVTNISLIGVKHLDILLVGSFVPPKDVAVYGVVKRLMTVVAMPLTMGNTAMSPFIPELYIQNEKKKLESLLRGTATLAAIPALIVLGALVIAPGTVLELLFGASYAAGSTALMILGTGYVFHAMLGSSGTTLVMTGRQKLGMINSLVTTLLYASLAPFLVARYGIEGGALAMATMLATKRAVGLALVRVNLGVWAHISLSPRFLWGRVRTLRRDLKPRNRGVQLRSRGLIKQ